MTTKLTKKQRQALAKDAAVRANIKKMEAEQDKKAREAFMAKDREKTTGKASKVLDVPVDSPKAKASDKVLEATVGTAAEHVALSLLVNNIRANVTKTFRPLYRVALDISNYLVTYAQERLIERLKDEEIHSPVGSSWSPSVLSKLTSWVELVAKHGDQVIDLGPAKTSEAKSLIKSGAKSIAEIARMTNNEVRLARGGKARLTTQELRARAQTSGKAGRKSVSEVLASTLERLNAAKAEGVNPSPKLMAAIKALVELKNEIDKTPVLTSVAM